ncbi:MAG: glycerate kinase [Verrucomicrobia bacterium]|nr:glycerate kinase [Verrucomicrobiota bacterium]
MRALLAFDKFKDALTAPQACDLTAAVLRRTHADWSLDLCPLADGGEGFAEILTRAAGGRLITQTVTGPRGAPVAAAFGLVRWEKIPTAARTRLDLPAGLPASAEIAVIEMAAASGLALVPYGERDPWHANSLGTGELMRAATAHDAAAILLGVGGSATNDLGLGALAALGLEFRTTTGDTVALPTPATWPSIARLEKRVRADLPPVRIACDVSNPLLGPNGCAAIYGPQKGLLPADRTRMENASARLALMLAAHCGQPESLMDRTGAGAAGGIAYGLMAAAGAILLPGADLVGAWLDLEARIAAADLVITGEGRFDDSSLSGKGPGEVARRALELGKAACVFAGSVTVTTPHAGLQLHAITPPGVPLPEALRTAGANLTATVERAL